MDHSDLPEPGDRQRRPTPSAPSNGSGDGGDGLEFQPDTEELADRVLGKRMLDNEEFRGVDDDYALVGDDADWAPVEVVAPAPHARPAPGASDTARDAGLGSANRRDRFFDASPASDHSPVAAGASGRHSSRARVVQFSLAALLVAFAGIMVDLSMFVADKGEVLTVIAVVLVVLMIFSWVGPRESTEDRKSKAIGIVVAQIAGFGFALLFSHAHYAGRNAAPWIPYLIAPPMLPWRWTDAAARSESGLALGAMMLGWFVQLWFWLHLLKWRAAHCARAVATVEAATAASGPQTADAAVAIEQSSSMETTRLDSVNAENSAVMAVEMEARVVKEEPPETPRTAIATISSASEKAATAHGGEDAPSAAAKLDDVRPSANSAVPSNAAPGNECDADGDFQIDAIATSDTTAAAILRARAANRQSRQERGAASEELF